MATKRAGLGPRTRARETTLQTLRRPRVLGVGLGMLAFIAFDVLATYGWTRLVHGHQSPFLAGLIVGGGVVGTAWVIWYFTVLTDGSWAWRVGALAEEWTSQELNRLPDSWIVIDSVPFRGRYGTVSWQGDIDHVAIGPAGVLSVQTKWTGDNWSLAAPEADDRLAAAAGMHERNTTQRLGPMVRHAAPNAELIPLLVCWGPRVEAGEQEVARLRSARIVAGYDSERWLKRLTAERLGAEDVARIAQVINARIADEERALGKTLEQRHRTLRMTRRSTRLAVGGLAWCVLTVTFVIVSSVWSPLGEAMNRLFRYTGSAVPGLWLLSVVPLALAAMVQARRLRKRLRRFEQPVAVASRNLAIAVSALLIWIGLFVGAVIAAR